MKSFTLVTDSACDLPIELLRELDIPLLPLEFFFGEKQYFDTKDEKNSMSYTDFYNRMRAGETPTTCAVPIGRIEEFLENQAAADKDVLYIAFSSGLSTTCNSGMIAAANVRQKYPDRKIFVVDSLCASLGQGLLVYLCAQKANEGASIEEVHDYAEGIKLNICHFFTVDDLKYLKRGGRVSATTALVGGILNIKPLLHVDNEGHLIKLDKAKGRKSSISSIAAYFKGNDLPESRKVAFICHGDCMEDATMLSNILKNDYGFEKVIIGYAGPVIGAHAGPGVLAAFFVGGKR